jgi:hypothetical protein
MPSEGGLTVRRMGPFRRALFGYSRSAVDEALAGRDARIWALERDAAEAAERCRSAIEAAARAEEEMVGLSGMVLDRERELRRLGDLLSEEHERHERGLASIEAISTRLEEIQAQARGQATRIRMKALREAMEVSRKVQELNDAHTADAAAGSDAEDDGDGNLFAGTVRVDIGPLGDFSQLVGFEDAAGQIDAASEISIERFSDGRATLSMHIDEPVELLRELEERSPLGFRVRRAADDNVVLDVDEDEGGPERHAA